MKNKIVLGLVIASGSVLLVLVLIIIFLTTTPEPPRKKDDVPIKPGETVERKDLRNPPPAPKAVANPNRVRQNLQPGKTYVTHTKGTLHVRGTDKAWGVETVVTINYVFEAQIDREIESNDGTTIVEMRCFRDVRSLKVETKLEDIRIELGPTANLLLIGIAVFQPDLAPAAGVFKALDGFSLKKVIQALPWAGISPEQLTGLDQSTKAFAEVDRLSGKSVRLTYVDGKGVVKLEAVKGDMTATERDFHMASVLVSDSLIIPNVDIAIGSRWSVDGSNFANLVDPALLARTSGEIVLERAPDHIVQDKTCRHLTVVKGRILFNDSDPKVGKIGYFEPQGSVYFSPADQVVIQARLTGKAKLEKFSKDHMLFETRMRRLPEMDIAYTCRMTETKKAP